jgi:hypothetical protein
MTVATGDNGYLGTNYKKVISDDFVPLATSTMLETTEHWLHTFKKCDTAQLESLASLYIQLDGMCAILFATSKSSHATHLPSILGSTYNLKAAVH